MYNGLDNLLLPVLPLHVSNMGPEGNFLPRMEGLSNVCIQVVLVKITSNSQLPNVIVIIIAIIILSIAILLGRRSARTDKRRRGTATDYSNQRRRRRRGG